MRKTIMMLLLTSVVTTPALSQSNDNSWHNRREAQKVYTESQRREAQDNRREIRKDRREVRESREEVRRDVARGDYGEAKRDMRELKRDKAELRQDMREAARDRRDWQNDGRRGDTSNWNRDWRNNRQYDWNRWRSEHRNRYHVPRYSPPHRHHYRRWYSGIQINPWFYGQRYWISDPWYYRLPPAYGSYRWVRYYDDVMLVDTRSGLIVDIIYNFFW